MNKIQMTIDNMYQIIYSLPMKLNISFKNMLLLLEAYRRKHILGSSDKFIGLGYISQYKSLLFEPSFTPVLKSLNWFKLTEKGKILLDKLENIFYVDNDIDMLNSRIFEFVNS